MDVKAEFKNGGCMLILTPSDEWEKKLLGAVAKGGETLSATITYRPAGHFSHGICEAVQVTLAAGRQNVEAAALTLRALDQRFRECAALGLSAEEAYDSGYQEATAEALAVGAA